MLLRTAINQDSLLQSPHIILLSSPSKELQTVGKQGSDIKITDESGVLSSVALQNDLTATKEMCIHCFNIILQDLLQDRTATLNPSLLDAISQETECPLFVTWDKKHQSKYSLRGCIGTLAPRPLKQALGDYAATSAFRDHRFNPIVINEVYDLRVGVSLLVNYELCQNCFDWEVGLHGIIIKFYFGGSHYNGTFLPEVAQQQGWSQQDTIAHLVHKAGFKGALSNDLLAAINCNRYQSSKQRMDFIEYKNIVGKDPISDELGERSAKKKWRGFF